VRCQAPGIDHRDGRSGGGHKLYPFDAFRGKIVEGAEAKKRVEEKRMFMTPGLTIISVTDAVITTKCFSLALNQIAGR
jgi:hypothetical protein